MVDDVESTQRIPCAGRWELADLVADITLDDAKLDSVTKVWVGRPSRPSWTPGRRSEAPPPPESPTVRGEIPRELLRIAKHGPSELHDTDECPTADLSNEIDLEWLDD